MKKITSSLVVAGTLALSTLISGSASAAGALTGNIGVMSDYFFRGADQQTSATANGGADYDLGNNLAIGAWAADMGDGLEIDLYGSYSGKVNQFDYSVGLTTYQYTGDSFDDATEINLNVGTGPVSLEFSIGSVDSSPSADYTFLALTFAQGGAYATYGTFGDDIDGSYIEVGYGREMGGMDVGIAIISADDDLSVVDSDNDGNTDSEISMALTVSKSFNLK